MKDITSKSDYYIVVAEIEKLLEKEFNEMTKEEEDRLDELTLAAHAYEKVLFPMPLPVTLPGVLEDYMASNKLNQTQLSQKLEIGTSTISALLSGKKKLNMDIAKKIHEKLNIEADLLLKVA